MATDALISERASGFVLFGSRFSRSWEIENQNVGTFNRELDPIARHAISDLNGCGRNLLLHVIEVVQDEVIRGYRDYHIKSKLRACDMSAS